MEKIIDITDPSDPAFVGNKKVKKEEGVSIPFFVTIILNLVLCLFVSQWVNTLLQGWTGTKTHWLVDLSIFAVVFALIFILGLRQVPIGHKGVLLILGYRLGNGDWWLDEGWQALLPSPIMGVEAIDCRIRKITTTMTGKDGKENQLDVLTKNNVKMTAEAEIFWNVVNPYKALSVGETVIESGVRSAGIKVLRGYVKNRNDGEINIDEVAEQLENEIDVVSEGWGFDATKVLVGEFLPSPEVVADLQNLRREEAQAAAEMIEVNGFVARHKVVQEGTGHQSPEKTTDTVLILQKKMSGQHISVSGGTTLERAAAIVRGQGQTT